MGTKFRVEKFRIFEGFFLRRLITNAKVHVRNRTKIMRNVTNLFNYLNFTTFGVMEMIESIEDGRLRMLKVNTT